MKRAFLIISAFLFIIADAEASIDGRWRGDGSLFTTGEEVLCEKADVEINLKAKTLEIERFSYRCGGKAVIWKPIRLTIKEGKLYQNRKRVGYLRNNRLELGLGDEREPGYVGAEFELSGDKMLIKEYRNSINGGELSSITVNKLKKEN